MKPTYTDNSGDIYQGDSLAILKQLPAGIVRTCVTSPPYWGLRDYGKEGQLGLEATPEEYISRLADIFDEVKRVLTDDGTLWLNLGDSYASNTKRGGGPSLKQASNAGARYEPKKLNHGVKEKDLVGIPWLAAFELRRRGWYLRSDIIWHKPNPMPESVTDRPTKAHEYIFLLSKKEKYFYDYEAIREQASEASLVRWAQNIGEQAGSERGNGGQKTNGPMKAVGGPKKDKQRGHGRRHDGFNARWDKMTNAEQQETGRNKRSVWTVATKPFSGAHFATFNPELITPCILAGSAEGDTVLDPFMGAGTTALVAKSAGRRFLGAELNPDYIEICRARLRQEVLL